MFMDDEFARYNARHEDHRKLTHKYAAGVAYVNGELAPLHEARIPMMEQGFLHADQTYDVPAAWDGRIFRFDDHLDRLERSCEIMRYKLPIPRNEIIETIKTMLAMAGLRDAYIMIIVGRGLQFIREQSAGDVQNTLYMYVCPYIWVMPEQMQKHGAAAVITRTVRRIPPGAIDPTVKNVQWGDFVRGLFEARDREAAYPILPDGDGNITEGSGFNVLLVKDNVIYTPERGVLQGITRQTVFDIAAAKGIEVRCEHVPVELCYSADEIFFSTTAGGIMPVTVLDGEPIGKGGIGPVTQTIWEAYWAAHYDPKYTMDVDYDAAKTVEPTE